MRGLKNVAIAHKKLDVDLMRKLKDAPSDQKTKKEKAASKKNSGAPKRPPSAYFVFMEEFRKSFKENFPENKSVAVVAKAGGEKWKSLSDTEKAPYVAKAAKRKLDYVKALKEFNNNIANGNGATGSASDKSTSEINYEAEQEASSN